MIVKVDISNETTFKKLYTEFIKLENLIISEDNVSYGTQDAIIIGLTFVFQASLSGFTWDIIKEQILPYLRLLFMNKRSKDRIYVYITDNEYEYDISIPDNFSNIEIKIPEELEMKLKK
jgi:hypothetical protein